MASACPFVAFDVGGVRDIVTSEQETQVVRAGAVDEFAERVLDLVKEPRLRERLAAAGSARVRDFDEARVAEMFLGMMRGNAPRWPAAAEGEL